MTTEEKKKKRFGRAKKKLDKILLGVVIGGAVGSILGVTLAPKAGKDTRKEIQQKGRETWEKMSEIIGEKTERFRKKRKKTIWHVLHDIFFRKK